MNEPAPGGDDSWLVFSISEVDARLVDLEGRPLHEGKAASQLFKEGVPYELHTCEYAGSRFRHKNPLNSAALKQTSRHFQEAIRCLVDVRESYITRVQPVKTFLDVYRVAEACSTLPTYLTLRADGVSRDALPPAVAVLAKMGFGIRAVARELSVRSIIESERDALPPVSANGIFQLAEEEGFLVGPKEVCAGPPHLIISLLETLMGEDPRTTRKVRRGGITIAPAAIDFALASIDLYLIRSLFFFIRRCFRKDLASHLGQVPPAGGKLGAALDRLPEIDEISGAMRSRFSPIVHAIAEALPDASPEERRSDLLHFWDHLSDGTSPETLDAGRRMISACLPQSREPISDMAALLSVGENDPLLAEFIIGYVRVEHWYVRALTLIEARMRASLARPTSPTRLSWSNLARLDGIRTRTYIHEVFGLHSPDDDNLLIGSDRRRIHVEDVVVDVELRRRA